MALPVESKKIEYHITKWKAQQWESGLAASWILNLSNFSFEYLSDGFTFMTGRSGNDYLNADFECIYALLHPNDQKTLSQCFLQDVIKIREGHLREDIYKFTIQMSCRIIGADGKYYWAQHEIQYLEIDRNNQPQLIAGRTTPLTMPPQKPCLSTRIIHRTSNGQTDLFYKIYPNNECVLSEREIEILTLIVGGNSNKNIAEKLFLSPHTINNHRQNIMKKMSVENSNEMIRNAVELGLV
ncbi:MAG: LuxR C-terminal-related transcriptional regulator [Cyclobacteriaceae bacterium]|nr:LuxR C-terminal-related transcriptional regulator [Cyclobacteriaceae bacterium]